MIFIPKKLGMSSEATRNLYQLLVAERTNEIEPDQTKWVTAPKEENEEDIDYRKWMRFVEKMQRKPKGLWTFDQKCLSTFAYPESERARALGVK